MKIIDLFNKIANYEEVPKKIKYNDIEWQWCGNCNIYESDTENCTLYDSLKNEGHLNDEVEVIENTLEIEEIQLCYYDDEEFSEQQQITVAFNKINQLIQAVKALKDKGE